MTKADWLLRFRRSQTLETLEKVYEHLKYTGDPADSFEMTRASPRLALRKVTLPYL